MGTPVEATRKLVLVIAVAAVAIVAAGIVLPAYLPRSATPNEIRLAFSIATDRATYTLGEIANVTVSLTNVGTTTAVLDFPNPCFWQFLAYDDVGGVVFNYSYLRGCIQMLAKVTLAPGQNASYHAFWNLVTDQGSPVPAPATYRLEPSFVWSQWAYQADVVHTDNVTVAVNP